MSQPRPGRSDIDAIDEEIRRIVLRSVRGNAELLRRASALGRSFLAQSGTQPPSMSETVNRIVRFNLEYFTLLSDRGQAFLEDVLDLANQHLLETPPAAAPAPAPASAPQLRLAARPGQSASGLFALENSFSTPATLSFTISAFRSSDGAVVEVAGVRFDPTEVTLAPGEERSVAVSVPIGSGFTAGQEYSARIRVEGSHGHEFGVVLRVEPEETPLARRPGRRKSGPAAGGAR